jgi:glutamate racemase
MRAGADIPPTSAPREAESAVRPIGVFDSGVGGLTVLRALRAELPAEHVVYLGDTARVPYGTKSPESVTRYAMQAARRLVERDVKLLVVACNTASAVALEQLAGHFAPLPVVGVVRPGAKAACERSATGRIAVIATESTVRGGAYQTAIRSLRPAASVVAQACSLFVALAEEGWTEGPLVEGVARRYLGPLFDAPERPDCLVLGCTHFPVLAGAIRNVVGPDVMLVDSAATTAVVVRDRLRALGLARRDDGGGAAVRFLATDGCERFRAVGERFLGESIARDVVDLVDL